MLMFPFSSVLCVVSSLLKLTGKPGPIPVGFGPRQQIQRVMNVRQNVPGEYLYLEIQLTRIR